MTNELTPDKLAALRALAMSATPGPYSIGYRADGTPFVVSDRFEVYQWQIAFPRSCDRDAVYIAALDPATVLALLDAAAERDALKAQVAELTLELGYPTKHFPTIRVDLTDRDYIRICPAGPFDIVELEHMQVEVSKHWEMDGDPEDAKSALCEVQYHAEESDYHTGLYIPAWWEITPISYEHFDADEFADIQKQCAARAAALLTEFQDEQQGGDAFESE